MRYTGYKYNSYDATYRKATFEVHERKSKSGVLEITEIESGHTFIIDFGFEKEKEKESSNNVRTKTWQKRGDQKKQKQGGVSITFGSKGAYEELKYSGRKRVDF